MSKLDASTLKISMFSYFKTSGKNKQAYTIAFYNLENLFDTKNDPTILDDDFTPIVSLFWSFKYAEFMFKVVSFS